MVKAEFRLAALAMTGMLAAGAANAQEVVNRTSDYALYWSNSTFANAAAMYTASYALGPSAFSDSTFQISILPNARNFRYVESGGVTVSSSAPRSPYPTTTTAVYSGNVPAGTWGTWGWQYDIAAGSGEPITVGKLGNLTTLNFDVGGNDNGPYSPGIAYYVVVYLPGNWTTPGRSTGDYILDSVGPGFSQPTFRYTPGSAGNPGFTTVESFDLDFTSGSPDLRFTLVGGPAVPVTRSSAVPESSTWAMMLLGFVGLGFAALRRARKTSVAITA